MNSVKCLRGVLICAMVSATVAWADDRTEQPRPIAEIDLAETLDRLAPAMAADDLNVRQQAQQQWQEICFAVGAPGLEAQRAEACRLMADKLGSGSPSLTQVWLLKQLERVGRDECVDAVVAALKQGD